MAACRCNFKRTFYVFLAAHFAKITVVVAKAVVKFLAGVNNYGFQFYIAIKKAYNLFNTFNTINLQIIYNGRLAGVLFGQDETFKTIFTGLYSYGQRAFDGLET